MKVNIILNVLQAKFTEDYFEGKQEMAHMDEKALAVLRSIGVTDHEAKELTAECANPNDYFKMVYLRNRTTNHYGIEVHEEGHPFVQEFGVASGTMENFDVVRTGKSRVVLWLRRNKKRTPVGEFEVHRGKLYNIESNGVFEAVKLV